MARRLIATLALAAATAAGQTFRDPPGLVLGVNAATAPLIDPGGGWPSSRLLRRDPATGEAWRVTIGAGGFGLVPDPARVELLVLSGTLRIGDAVLDAGDYARWRSGVGAAAASAAAGTVLLLFRDPVVTTPAPPSPPEIVRGASLPWRSGQVARNAGAPAPIEVKMYRLDPATGARFSLIRMAPGGSVPWEVHATAEEGYLLDGDYHLAECLPSGRRDFDYRSGGYFYRPPGLLHSGPESTTRHGATWLVRTPGALTAVFYAGCPQNRSITRRAKAGLIE